MITVIVVGDITLAGYALSARSSGVLIIGALFPLMALYQLHRFNRMMLPAIYTAVSLEQKYGGRDTDWLTSTLMSTFLSPESVETMVKISAEPNRVERIEKLRRVKIRPMGGGKGFVRAGLVFVAIAQFIAPIILTLAFQWHLF